MNKLLQPGDIYYVAGYSCPYFIVACGIPDRAGHYVTLITDNGLHTVPVFIDHTRIVIASRLL